MISFVGLHLWKAPTLLTCTSTVGLSNIVHSHLVNACHTSHSRYTGRPSWSTVTGAMMPRRFHSLIVLRLMVTPHGLRNRHSSAAVPRAPHDARRNTLSCCTSRTFSVVPHLHTVQPLSMSAPSHHTSAPHSGHAPIMVFSGGGVNCLTILCTA